MKSLTPRQRRFVEEYLVDLNGAGAARRAGYSARSADGRAARLRAQPHVAAEIERRMAERSQAVKVSAERVLSELAKIGFADVRRMFTPAGDPLPVTELDDDVAAAVASMEVTVKPARSGEGEPERTYKIRTWDKRMALTDIGKHLGMFKERAELAPEKTSADFDGGGMELAARISAILEAARRRQAGQG